MGYDGDACDWCMCQSPAPERLALSIQNLYENEREGLVYKSDSNSNTPCEACIHAYVESCPFLADRISDIWAYMGEMSIQELTSSEINRSEMMNFLGTAGAIEPCDRFELEYEDDAWSEDISPIHRYDPRDPDDNPGSLHDPDTELQAWLFRKQMEDEIDDYYGVQASKPFDPDQEVLDMSDFVMPSEHEDDSTKTVVKNTFVEGES